jgi:UDP-N-acetylglucosamine acyltransferase
MTASTTSATEVHPSAHIDGDVVLADGVRIGPSCMLEGPIRIGAGTRLVGHVHLQGPLEMGEGNTVYPFTCLGFAPQDLKWDPGRAGAGLRIGSGNVFREGVTIHRATSDERPTTVGDGNFWMANSHAGHDAAIGDHCIFANATLLAGHTEVHDRVITGGHATLHQFCRIGRGAMLSGNMGTQRDIAPFFLLTGIDVIGSINLVGLRRSGMSAKEIDDVKWVYRTIYREGLALKSAIERMRERSDRPLVAEYIAFCENSRRGLTPGVPKPQRRT